MRTLATTMTVLFLALASAHPPSAVAQDEAEEAERGSRPELVDGMPVVRIDEDLQRRSGIETLALEEVKHEAETAAYGEVVDIQPLLAQRAEHHRLLADRGVVTAALDASRRDYERLRALREQRSYSSEQELVAAEARWQGDRARAEGLTAQLADLRAQMLQTWGARLTTWALDGGSQAYDGLLDLTQVLILVTLRPGDTLPDDVA
jgi:hypothetical protein